MKKVFSEMKVFQEDPLHSEMLSSLGLKALVSEVMRNDKVRQEEYAQNLQRIEQFLSQIEKNIQDPNYLFQLEETDYDLFLEIEKFIHIVGDHIEADVQGEYGPQVQMTEANQKNLADLRIRFERLQTSLERQDGKPIEKAA